MATDKTPKSGTDSGKEMVRVTFRLHGPELLQVREVRDMLSLNSELDAARYLMQRGMEAMTATLASRKASNSMASKVNVDEIVSKMMPKLIAAAKAGEI